MARGYLARAYRRFERAQENTKVRELLWTPAQPPTVSAVALFLHGGAVRSHRPVTRTASTFQRARWLRNAIAPSLGTSGIASVLLKYEVRGWNAKDGEPAPLADARWALAEVAARHDVPIVLVGHSMGGRTGLHVADHPNVVGLVAVAPWFPKDEPVEAIRGRHLTVLHGTQDRITSPGESRIVTERAHEIAASTKYTPMPSLGHYLLAQATDWHRATRDEVLRITEMSRESAV